MGLNILRIMVFITSIVLLAGCTTVIDRGRLESEVFHEEGVKSASIDIVAQCDFGQLSVDAITRISLAQPVFLLKIG